MRSLRSMIILAVLPILAASLAALILVSHHYARRSAQETVGGVLAEVSRATLDTIYRNLFERIGDVQAFASNPAAVALDAQAVTRAIDTFMVLYGIYDVMVVCDRSGTVIAVNSVDHAGAANPRTRQLLGQSLAGEAWFASVLRQQPGSVSTDYEDLRQLPQIAEVCGGDGLVLRFSAPIIRDGAVVGVWTNYASWDRIVRAILHTLADPARPGAGKLDKLGYRQAEVLLLNREGRAIYDGVRRGRAIADYAPEELGELRTAAGQKIAAARQADDDRAGFSIEAHPRHGVEWVSGWAWQASALGVRFDNYGWGLIIRAPLSQALASVHDLLWMQIAVAAIAFAIAIAVAMWLARTIVAPIAAVERAMAAIASGDLQATVAVAARHEAGRMAASVNAMIGRWRDIIEQLARLSSLLSEQAAQQRALAQRLVSESASATQAANTATATAQQVASTIASVATASEEMSASIGEISHRTSEAAALAREAAGRAQASNSTMQALASTSRQIGDIISTISSIAEQTKLLSLNATIEAARAGEAGRGFAVVANEIRTLAGTTGASTEQIGQRIAAIQGSADEAVRALDDIRSQVDRIDQAQQTIAAAVEEQAATSKEMSQHLATVNANAREIGDQMQSVGRTAQQVMQAAQEAEQASAALARSADELRQLINGFKR